MKARYLRELTGGRGVVFATGTPISNTMVEMYTMQRYLAPGAARGARRRALRRLGGDLRRGRHAMEISPDGAGYRMHTRFAKFINLPELLQMFRAFADVQTAEMLNLPRPDAGRRQAAHRRGACRRGR